MRSNVDGYVTIDTQIDTKGIDKGIVSIETKLEKLRKKAEQPFEIDGVEVSGGWNLSKEEQQYYNSLKTSLDRLNLQKAEMVMSDKQIVEQINNQTVSTEKYNSSLETNKSKLVQISYNIEEMVKNYNAMQNQNIISSEDIKDAEKLKYEIMEAKKEYEKLSGTTLRIKGITDTNTEINNIGSSIQKVTKKVAKWGLAIFGIRTLYLGIRQIINQVLQSDQTLSNQMEYMKWSLGQAIKPIVETIVRIVYKILVGIGALIKILFGVNIFANATANAFLKQKKALAGSNKQAKELQKTLSGFDEMNVLNKDGSVGTSKSVGGLGNLGDLSKDVETLASKLEPFEDKIKTISILVAGIFGASVITNWLNNLGLFSGEKGLGKLNSKLVGIKAIVGGIFITALIAKQVWDEAQELKEKLETLRELSIKFQEDFIDNETNIAALINTGNVNRTAGLKLLEDSESWLHKILGLSEEEVKQAEQTAINIGKQIDKEVDLYKKDVKKNGVTEENKILQDQIKQEIIDQIEYNKKLIEKLDEQGLETDSIKTLNEDLIKNYQDMGGDVSVIKDELGNINNINFKDKKLTVDISADTSDFEKAFSNLINGTKNLIISAKSGKSKFAKGGIAYYSRYKLPRLASGGILNQPGRGVPIASAIGGERGAEGVIPLTDSQQMALLGEAIGKHVVIENIIDNYIDGKKLNRILRTSQDRTNFAMNR